MRPAHFALSASFLVLLAACGASGSDGGDDAGAPDDAGGDLGVVGGGTDATRDTPPPTDGGGDGARDTRDGGGEVAPSDAPADAPPDAPVATATIHTIGRFDATDPAALRFEWPASAIVATFDGTTLDARLVGDANMQIQVVVDGAATSVIKPAAGTDTYTVASGLPAGKHTVMLYRRTESFFQPLKFGGFSPASALVPSPAPHARTIELVGDSITCGYGDEGTSASCPFTPDTENEYLTYGALTARALDADQVAIAWSGKGMYRDYGGGTTEQMPELWDRTIPTEATSAWAFTGYTPDAVVINLGTNDFAKGDPGAPFVDAYVAFLAKVRGRYPGAFVFCTTSPLLGGTEAAQHKGYVQAAIDARKAKGDTRVALVDFPTQDGAVDGLGCDYHPSLKTHAKMAAILTAAIKAQLGW